MTSTASPARIPGALVLALVCGGLAILSAPWALDQPWMNLLFKPLATLSLLVFAGGRGRDRPVQRRWVLIGLSFSLLGDVALLWPQQGFLPGLVCFLFAHVAYLVAFVRERRLAARPWPFLIYIVLAGAMLAFIWSGVPPTLRGPVGGYALCLAAMAAQATVLFLCGTPRSAGLALGGALFVCSDALLAIDRFVQPLPWASLLILLPYWTAQALIASWLAPKPWLSAPETLRSPAA